MKSETSNNYHANFKTYEDYKKHQEQITNEFERQKKEWKSPLQACINGAVEGISLGFQLIVLGRLCKDFYKKVHAQNLLKDKRGSVEDLSSVKLQSSEESSVSNGSNEVEMNSEPLRNCEKISQIDISSETTKVAEVFTSNVTNCSFDYLKNGIKRALMDARAEAKLDGSNGKKKVDLSELMSWVKKDIKKPSSKFENDQSLAVKLAKEKIESFIVLTNPNLNAGEYTKRLLLSDTWSDYESRVCLNRAATFLKDEIGKDPALNNGFPVRGSYTNGSILQDHPVTEYNYYDDCQSRYVGQSCKQTSESVPEILFMSETQIDHGNEQQYRSRNFILKENTDPNLPKYQSTDLVRELLNGNYGDALDEFLANPGVEEALDASQEGVKSAEKILNESSRSFVFDGFNPYDSSDPYH